MIPNADFLQLEDRLWLVVRQIGLPIYDFNFRDWFHTRSASEVPQGVNAVARVGAIAGMSQPARAKENSPRDLSVGIVIGKRRKPRRERKKAHVL